ncbi:ring-1,2-phenylacetyl-CoA epoxidase subunit PaaD [Virgibacillus campisalis]|uniref:Ring-1,2-phenylacetyl-CoA epoxidase subunit PaaD n=2 Tax=Virgibacillus alimentarius TaxID=698769 RepID=A0ABS4SBH1_9BACI|nr:ring-1,2-phenylacetyl-CoA epoxidase subunit PaaD [Virgibacillus alimentarius]
MMKTDLSKEVMEVLSTVKDPEIDSVSIIDLGMVENVICGDDKAVKVQLIPTFLGCPALDIIAQNVQTALEESLQLKDVEVEFLKEPHWTSERITELGRIRLKEFGIAPPPRKLSMIGPWEVNCPYCDSPYTTMENIFGPTACRSILYCSSCKNPFEAMKPISSI